MDKWVSPAFGCLALLQAVIGSNETLAIVIAGCSIASAISYKADHQP